MIETYHHDFQMIHKHTLVFYDVLSILKFLQQLEELRL